MMPQDLPRRTTLCQSSSAEIRTSRRTGSFIAQQARPFRNFLGLFVNVKLSKRFCRKPQLKTGLAMDDGVYRSCRLDNCGKSGPQPQLLDNDVLY